MSEWFLAADFRNAIENPQQWISELLGAGFLHARVKCLAADNSKYSLGMGANRERFIQIVQSEEAGIPLVGLLHGFADSPDLLSDAPDSTSLQRLLKAYRRWGFECVRRLTGEWTFVVVDPTRSSVFVARDAMGTRPLYYRQFPWGMLLGSRAQKLANAPQQPRSGVDEASLLAFATGADLWPSSSMFRGVCRLPPGCSMSLRGYGEPTVRTWWCPEPDFRATHHSAPDQLGQLREALSSSVRDALLFGEKPAIALSGGVDSSAIAGFAKTLVEKGEINRPVTISEIFPRHPMADESPRIRELVAALGMDSHYVEPTPDEDLLKALAQSDTPATVAWGATNFALARAARDCGCDVVLYGTLGDIIGGTRSSWHSLLEESRTEPEGSAQWLFQCLRRLRSASRLLRGRLPDFLHDLIHFAVSALPKDRQADHLRRLARQMESLFGGPLGARSEQSLDLLSAADREARTVDWNLGHWGEEVAFPFLDRRVVEASLSLDARMRFSGGLDRSAVRALVEGYVPDSIRLNGRKTVLDQFFLDHLERTIAKLDGLRTWMPPEGLARPAGECSNKRIRVRQTFLWALAIEWYDRHSQRMSH